MIKLIAIWIYGISLNPKRRGFGKRHLYNMVKFYDTYSTDEFNQLGKLLRLDEFVQLPIAQKEGEIAQSVPTQLPLNEIVQSPIAQLDTPLINMPRILALATFTSHIEIMNRCKSYDERVFYMLYAARQRLNTEELRRCIVNQTYSTLLDKDKMLSPQLLKDYPSSATSEHEKHDRIESLCSVMDMLVLNQKGSIVQSLKKYVPVLIEDNPEKREDVASFIGKMYNIRSQHLHHDNQIDVSWQDVYFLNYIAKVSQVMAHLHNLT